MKSIPPRPAPGESAVSDSDELAELRKTVAAMRAALAADAAIIAAMMLYHPNRSEALQNIAENAATVTDALLDTTTPDEVIALIPFYLKSFLRDQA